MDVGIILNLPSIKEIGIGAPYIKELKDNSNVIPQSHQKWL
jgi:hypothetical protein